MSTKLMCVALLAASFVSSGSACAQQQDERSLLFSGSEFPALPISRTSIRGRLGGQDLDIVLEVARSDGGQALNITTSRNGVQWEQVVVRVPGLNRIDLSSAQFHAAERPDAGVRIELKFGERNECFINDDGRRRLGVYFEPGAPAEAYMINYVDCEPSPVQVNLN